MRDAPRSRVGLLAVGALLLFGVLAVGGVGAAPAGVGPARATMQGHALAHSTSVDSTNWAGWVVTGGTHSVTDVKGSWVVPKIQGSCPSSKYEYSSYWVGIDGYSSSTVEQIGTDSDCQGGTPTYYAWYEFYPAGSVLISSITVKPGDAISAQVKFASGHFRVSITDVTRSKSFGKNASVTASRDSAEWIAEAPSSSSGILPLADFGTVGFGNASTGLTSTNTATVGGTTGSIGSFTNTVEITMVNNAGTANKAVPSALSTDGLSFNVTWKSTGP